MVEEQYEQAKKRLRELQYEHSDLTTSLRSAITDNNAEKVSRLRLRLSEIPREIAEAELGLVSTKVAFLRAEQAKDQQELEEAKVKSKDTDMRVEAELKELEAKRKALSDERYACLRDVYRLKDAIQRRAGELQTAGEELKKRLENVV
jgi:chromosome segregation ATPase